MAQALVADPRVVLCDEPLLSLDLQHQQDVTALLDRRRREDGTAVVFVTHEINPVLPYVDRVLYLAGGRWAIGAPDEVFTSSRLSALYGATIDVVRVRDRIVVLGADGEVEAHLSACPECQGRAAASRPCDTLVELVAASARGPTDAATLGWDGGAATHTGGDDVPASLARRSTPPCAASGRAAWARSGSPSTRS